MDEEKFSQLQESLNYLHVAELKDYCTKFALSTKGKKSALINRILHFLQTGEKIDVTPYPRNSVGRGASILAPNELMLKNIYKNDLKTRIFFKKLIGDYFHFTAFGIDWLQEAWMAGKPPTYQEFADMWRLEYKRRQEFGSQPKEEWAYIRFVQKYLNETNTDLKERNQILEAWEKERLRHKEIIRKLI